MAGFGYNHDQATVYNYIFLHNSPCTHRNPSLLLGRTWLALIQTPLNSYSSTNTIPFPHVYFFQSSFLHPFGLSAFLTTLLGLPWKISLITSSQPTLINQKLVLYPLPPPFGTLLRKGTDFIEQ